MPTPIQALLVVLIVPSGLVFLYWAVVAFYALKYHMIPGRSRIPTARDGLSLPEAAAGADSPTVCVIVPAHNEQEIVGDLARSLARQDYPALRVVFALDRCTDDTKGEVEAGISSIPARSPPIEWELLDITSCPPDWAGKVNAMWTAVNQSRLARDADLLLFADADTTFDPGCVRATAALLENRRLDMLTLLSTLSADRWFERFVQPATALELVRQYPMHKANRPAESRRAFANGQFILCRREPYLRIRGHEAVKFEMFEDVRLAQHIAREGLSAGVFLADGMLRCRMYADWAEFQRGWNRIFSESCNRKPARLRTSAMRSRVIGAIGPVMAVATLALAAALFSNGERSALVLTALVTSAAALIAIMFTLSRVYAASGAPLWLAVTFPFAAWMTGSILRQTAEDLENRKPVIWAGREYVREAR
ncbi:MAG: glycosyltransferase [Phycisphaeraceae bacterium]|nr:glycosyltransferase [Phycisphaeraceae bacterium]